MRHRACLLVVIVLTLASLVGCGGGSLYDPITITEIDHGKVPPGLAALDAHVAIMGSIRCYPQTNPTKCFYRAVAPDSDEAKRQAQGETVTLFDETERMAVLVRFKPGAEKEPGFASRPKSDGRFTKLALLDYDEQKAFLSLDVNLRSTVLYIPDSGEAGFFGSWLPIPIFVGVGLAIAFLVYVAVRASRGGDTDPAKYAPQLALGGPSRSTPPPQYVRPPSVPPPSVPPPPAPWPSGPPPPFASQPPPEGPPRLSLPPGTRVIVTRADGTRTHASFVRGVQGRCLCEVDGVGREWVAAEQVKRNE
jgi:hypothetical protein